MVVGDLREQDELSSMTSVTVVGADDLSSKQAEHLEEALAFLPNVNFASGTNRPAFPNPGSVSGASLRARKILSGVLIDGIDFTGAADVAWLLDLDQLEVLRGPQDSLRASGLAGLIHRPTLLPEPSADWLNGITDGARLLVSLSIQ